MSCHRSINLLRCRAPGLMSKRTAKGSIKGYVYLLPDVCTDTPENNRLLATVTQTELPEFSKFDVSECIRGLGRMAMDYRYHVENHLKSIDLGDTPTFESVFGPIDEELAPLNYAAGITNLLVLATHVKDNDILEDTLKAFDEFTLAKERAISIAKMYRLSMELYRNSRDLTGDQRSVAGSYALHSHLLGMDMTTKERELYRMQCIHFNRFRAQYVRQISLAYPNFEHEIDDPQHMADAPDHVKHRLLDRRLGETDFNKGPWTVKLAPLNYWYFLRYCSNRERRFNAWYAWNTRAGWHHSQTNNSICAEELRAVREKMARILRLDTFTNLRMRQTMAGSLDNVNNFIDTLKERFKPAFTARYEELCKFAEKEHYIKEPLSAWDLYYFSRKHAEVTHDIDPQKLSEYFPFVHVFVQLIQLSEYWFDLQFKDVTKQVEVWHPSVKVFQVNDKSGELRGHLYVDPYAREGKGGLWQKVVVRDRSQCSGYTPIIALMGDAVPPSKTTKTLLHYSEVTQLLRTFGSSLCTLLSHHPYASSFSLDWAERDGQHTLQSFFELLFYQPAVMQFLSRHHETDEQLTMEKAQTVCQGLASAHLFDVYRNLFISEFDIAIHSVPEVDDSSKYFWLRIYRQLYRDYFPFPQEKDEWMMTNFTPIFSHDQASIFYKGLWSEMLALDLIESFKEGGGFEDRPKTVAQAKRLKDVIISQYGAARLSELFRQFRGRDPSTEPLLEFYAPGNSTMVGDKQKLKIDS